MYNFIVSITTIIFLYFVFSGDNNQHIPDKMNYNITIKILNDEQSSFMFINPNGYYKYFNYKFTRPFDPVVEVNPIHGYMNEEEIEKIVYCINNYNYFYLPEKLYINNNVIGDKIVININDEEKVLDYQPDDQSEESVDLINFMYAIDTIVKGSNHR